MSNSNSNTNYNNYGNYNSELSIQDPWNLKIYVRKREDPDYPWNFTQIPIAPADHYQFQVRRITPGANTVFFFIQDEYGDIETHTVRTGKGPYIKADQLGIAYETLGCGDWKYFMNADFDFDTKTYKMYYVCSGARPVPAMEERAVPEGSTNNITYDDIRDGEEMANFQGEFEHGRYYKKDTVDRILRGAQPRNPYTRANLRASNVKTYKAKVGGRRRHRKTRVTRRLHHRKTRTSHRHPKRKSGRRTLK